MGQIASLSVALAVTGLREQVDVREAAQGIDTQESEVSQVIGRDKIADLPIAGRDFIDFVLLTPTANVGRSTAVGSQSPFTETVLQLSFGGLRETHSTLFALDGVDYTTSISGVQRISPSQDWVQEFRVVASPYSAENGRNLGSVVNTVTKSGTNGDHGSLYEYFARIVSIEKPAGRSRFQQPALQSVWRHRGRATSQRPNFLFCRLRGPTPRGITHLFFFYPSLYRHHRMPRPRHPQYQSGQTESGSSA